MLISHPSRRGGSLKAFSAFSAFLSASLATVVALVCTTPALAQTKKDSLILAMTLEPPGLDPTAGAASAISEVTLYNVYETLTKVNADSKITGLLAESWTPSADLKTWTFKLDRKSTRLNSSH